MAELRNTVEERNGGAMLQAETPFVRRRRNRVVAHDDRLLEDLDLDLANGARLDLRARDERGLDGGVRGAAGRPRLEARLPDLPRRIFGTGDRRPVSVGTRRREEPERAFENLARRREAGRRQFGGDDARLRGPRR